MELILERLAAEQGIDRVVESYSVCWGNFVPSLPASLPHRDP
jgi:hypothetical protein